MTSAMIPRTLVLLWLFLFSLVIQGRAQENDGQDEVRDRGGAGKARLVAQIGHSHWISSAAFSPDGRLVLTGGATR